MKKLLLTTGYPVPAYATFTECSGVTALHA